MQSAAPNECEKYKLLVEETDKITSLLLGLSGRLARTENSLQVAIMLSSKGDTQEKVKWSLSLPSYTIQFYSCYIRF